MGAVLFLSSSPHLSHPESFTQSRRRTTEGKASRFSATNSDEPVSERAGWRAAMTMLKVAGPSFAENDALRSHHSIESVPTRVCTSKDTIWFLRISACIRQQSVPKRIPPFLSQQGSGLQEGLP